MSGVRWEARCSGEGEVEWSGVESGVRSVRERSWWAGDMLYLFYERLGVLIPGQYAYS